MQASCCLLLVSILAVTLCDICMPEAFWSSEAPPPSPPLEGRGVITEIPLRAGCRLFFTSLLVSSLAETLCVICMPKAFCGFETVHKKGLLNLWVLWEKNLPSESQAFFLTWRVYTYSHRGTQKNRTHKPSQRHQVNRYHRTLQPTKASPPAPLRMERGVITEVTPPLLLVSW